MTGGTTSNRLDPRLRRQDQDARRERAAVGLPPA